MGSAIEMRMDYSAAELRRQAKSSTDSKHSRRLLSLACKPVSWPGQAQRQHFHAASKRGVTASGSIGS